MLTVSWLHPSTKGTYITEAVVQRYSVKKVFLEYHRKTPVPVSLFLINVQAATCNFIIKKRHRQRFFPVNFAKFLRPLFLTEHLRWLLPILVLWWLPFSRSMKSEYLFNRHPTKHLLILKTSSRRLPGKQNFYWWYLYLTNLTVYLANLCFTNYIWEN